MSVKNKKINEFQKQKIMRNLVTLDIRLNLNDQFQKLLVQKTIFSQRILDNIIKNESSSLNYCMVLLHYGQNAFTQLTDILIETNQNYIADLLLNTN